MALGFNNQTQDWGTALNFGMPMATGIQPTPTMGFGVGNELQQTMQGWQGIPSVAGLQSVNQPSFMEGMLGKNGQQGWGNMALGALQGFGGAFMGMKQYGLAKDALKQSQNQFNLNYGAQRQSINTQLEDRQRARVAATEGHAESVDSYMDRNRIK